MRINNILDTNLNNSWLKSRTNTIKIFIFDNILISFLLLNTDLYSIGFSNLIIFSLVVFSNNIFNYLFGRYYKNNIKYLSFFLKDLLKSTIIYSLNIIFISIVFKINQILYLFDIYDQSLRDILYLRLLHYSFLSFIFLNIFRIFIPKIKISRNINYIGNLNTLNILKSEIKQTNLEFEINSINSSEIISNPKEFRRIDEIIFDDTIKLKEKFSESLISKKIKENAFIKPITWSENYLQKLPSDLIEEDFLRNQNYFTSKFLFKNLNKRTFDLFVSSFLIIITSPLILIFAVLIKIEDGGPIFYSQIRTGKDEKIFKIFKLRSMKIDAEKKGPQWATRNDQRITKIGRIIRKMRIDELPQLISVFKGEMSLIGPRPERPEINSLLMKKIPFYNLRHKLKPGISGWAQVNYRYGSSFIDAKNKLGYDLYYIKNQSNMLDILIFFKTIKVVFTLYGSTPK